MQEIWETPPGYCLCDGHGTWYISLVKLKNRVIKNTF